MLPPIAEDGTDHFVTFRTTSGTNTHLSAQFAWLHVIVCVWVRESVHTGAGKISELMKIEVEKLVMSKSIGCWYFYIFDLLLVVWCYNVSFFSSYSLFWLKIRNIRTTHFLVVPRILCLVLWVVISVATRWVKCVGRTKRKHKQMRRHPGRCPSEALSASRVQDSSGKRSASMRWL